MSYSLISFLNFTQPAHCNWWMCLEMHRRFAKLSGNVFGSRRPPENAGLVGSETDKWNAIYWSYWNYAEWSISRLEQAHPRACTFWTASSSCASTRAAWTSSSSGAGDNGTSASVSSLATDFACPSHACLMPSSPEWGRRCGTWWPTMTTTSPPSSANFGGKKNGDWEF